MSDGGMGIDATAPLGEVYEEILLSQKEMDFSQWFSKKELDELKCKILTLGGWER